MKPFLFFIIFHSFISTTLLAVESCEHTETELRCVKYIKNYDADTITFDIPGLHQLVGKKMNIRVEGVDTPEIRTKNKCEKEKARHAKKLVAHLLKRAKRIDLQNIQRGKYFRIVAEVRIDGILLGEYLVKNGLGYPYKGGTKLKVDWCKDVKVLAKEFQMAQEADRSTASQRD